MIWKSYIESYRQYLLLERSLSAHSISGYLSDLKKLSEYDELSEMRFGPLKTDIDHLRKFLVFLNELGLGRRSQARLISTLKGFYKFLLLEDLISTSPAELLESPRIGLKLPAPLSFDEIKKMLNRSKFK